MLQFKNIKIVIASSFKDKLIGLMFKKNINYGLLLKNCRSIHTFFMKDAIDVVAVDEKYKIIDKRKNVLPNKILIFNKKVKHIYELPKGTIK